MGSLLRSVRPHAGRAKGPPKEDAPEGHATAAEEHLIEKSLVEANPSSVKFSKKILKNAAESGVPE
jgi:hypothetical protein